MTRIFLAAAAALLPLTALAQAAPTKPVAEPAQQASPEKRGFSIARKGMAAPQAKPAQAAGHANATAPMAAAPAAGKGMATHHKRHRRHHRAH